MKRSTLVKIHVTATVVATLTIAFFFTSSLAAEINGSPLLIRKVKEVILFSLTLLLLAMPALGITGNKLAGNSQHPTVLAKRKRMRFVLGNGMILITLACFLYYRAHHHPLDHIFLGAQVAELILGLANLTLLGLNIRSGFQLSGRWKKRGPLRAGR
ncbi:MAG TPA: hypothetical protein VHK69_09450 [Chitinophagaceae bacterium]|jgi:hypothetical protein|nr:hypothetical protein [Chitinophagaceae bacterium]